MTTIVAVRSNVDNSVLVAADTKLVTSGEVVGYGGKLIHLYDDDGNTVVVVGVSGVRSAFTAVTAVLAETVDDGQSVLKHFYRQRLPELIYTLRKRLVDEYGFKEGDADVGLPDLGYSLLIVTRTDIVEVTRTSDIIYHPDQAGVGSGCAHALAFIAGARACGQDVSYNMIEKAINYAATVDLGTGGSIDTMSVESLDE